ncbi:16S rRNA (guanine(966)-N(2))-methyltransferase RsmD [Dasania marina]|uniref:16S rRNA (guanine(966)-N(2))-methyltransferase RsmD n=1 Tax=Dasania marina TaxID=471499 RepID=UPI000372DC5D|nr:16S rRNA (guanine(966)-N(2))-methyltransferase RsmD [Dasania marina]|tara:strand:- start:14990 stop:15577 length:588 start_codon:yes stop_codon:yes gene_type:complete
MAKQQKHHSSNQLRIIGGLWRGRKLSFPSLEGLRPTPDRVRETLFNWLAPELPGARCLDLFCGSGALGLEALSRGAARVDMVDNAREAVQQLRSNMALLQADTSQAKQDNALNWLSQRQLPYDIIFLDPPFRSGLAQECITALAQQPLFKDPAWLYLEMGRDEALPSLPSHWHLHREKTAGQVRYQLFRIETAVG